MNRREQDLGRVAIGALGNGWLAAKSILSITVRAPAVETIIARGDGSLSSAYPRSSAHVEKLDQFCAFEALLSFQRKRHQRISKTEIKAVDRAKRNDATKNPAATIIIDGDFIQ